MPQSSESRALDERRIQAITALNAMVDAVRGTSPQTLLVKDDDVIDPQQRQQIARTWATGCGDLIEQMHRLTTAIGEDALSLFQNGQGAGESRAIRAAAS
jgi:phosphate uptake regulator